MLDDDTLPIRSRKELALLAKQFEEKFGTGRVSGIREFAPHISPQRDGELFLTLLSVELKLRRKRGETPAREAFVRAFPEFHIPSFSDIDSAFGEETEAFEIKSSNALLATEDLDPDRTRAESDSVFFGQTGDPLQSRFHHIRKHAEGGLGQVFLASDQELRREVALKEIQPQYNGESESRSRFVLEAQVTGFLEHPGIVPVYSLGAYPDGRPYYAMRFVRGESFQSTIISAYKELGSITRQFYYSRQFRSLIRRFIDVCNAIHYAHEKGVLHRDIKPDNIMLGRYGETLVVDWGLAKLMDSSAPTDSHSRPANEELRQFASATTRGGIGTPLYMSPEQARGEVNELTCASDIYSLGATLFSIASNKPPFPRKEKDLMARVRAGQAYRVRELIPNAPWAIEAICTKAMQLNPAERYESAEQLALDLERWLADDPIVVDNKTEPILDRFGRTLRKYRSWTVPTFAACVLVSVIGLSATVIVNNSRLEELFAKQQAQEFKREAIDRYRMSQEAIDTWLVDAGDSLQYFPATQSLRKEMLKKAAADYRRLSSEMSQDPELELERLKALTRVGDIQSDQEQFDNAATTYKTVLEELESRNQLSEKLDPEIRLLWRAEAPRIGMKLAIVEYRQGNRETAEVLFEKGFSQLRGLLAQRNVEAASYLAYGLTTYAALLLEDGENSKSLDLLRESSALLQGFESPKSQIRAVQNRTLESLCYKNIGKYPKSRSSLETNITVLSDLARQEFDNPLWTETLAANYVALALLSQDEGRLDDCMVELSQAIELYRSLVASLPDVPTYKASLATSLLDLGLIDFDQAHVDSAYKALSEAEGIYRELTTYFPLTEQFRFGLASALDGLGQVASERGDFTDSAELLSDSYRIFETLAKNSANSKDDSMVPSYVYHAAVALSHYAHVQSIQGESLPPTMSFKQAVDWLDYLVSENPEIPEFRFTLAHVEFRWADHLRRTSTAQMSLIDSERHFQNARDLWSALVEEFPTARNHYQLAWFHLHSPVNSLCDATIALTHANEAVSAVENNPNFQDLLLEALLRNQQLAKAEVLLAEILANRSTLAAPCLLAKTRLHYLQKDLDSARETLERARDQIESERTGNLDLQRYLEVVSHLLAAPDL